MPAVVIGNVTGEDLNHEALKPHDRVPVVGAGGALPPLNEFLRCHDGRQPTARLAPLLGIFLVFCDQRQDHGSLVGRNAFEDVDYQLRPRLDVGDVFA